MATEKKPKVNTPKIKVWPTNYDITVNSGRIVFAFKTDKLLTPGNVSDIMDRAANFIKNELENRELLLQPKPESHEHTNKP